MVSEDLCEDRPTQDGTGQWTRANKRNIYHSNKHKNQIPNYPFMLTTSFATNSNHAIELMMMSKKIYDITLVEVVLC